MKTNDLAARITLNLTFAVTHLSFSLLSFRSLRSQQEATIIARHAAHTSRPTHRTNFRGIVNRTCARWKRLRLFIRRNKSGGISPTQIRSWKIHQPTPSRSITGVLCRPALPHACVHYCAEVNFSASFL